jgi:hypothetical protein
MKKTDNHNAAAKLELRRYFLKKLRPGFSVLDAFSGEREAIWTQLRGEFYVGGYLALDIKPKKNRLKIDSLKYLRGQKWNHDVIDLDAYGSPWDCWAEVLKRGKACTVFLTVGAVGMSAQSHKALGMAGIPKNTPTGIHSQIKDEVTSYCVAAITKYGMVSKECKEALNPGGNARYIGIQIEPTHT